MENKNEKKSEIWEVGQDLIKRMDNLFANRPNNNFLESIDSFFQQSNAFGRIPVKVYETQTEWVVELELPGLRKEDIHLNIIGDKLHVQTKNEQATEVDDEKANYHYHQYRYMHRERTIQLPYPVDQSTTKAIYENGILIVRGPKPQQKTTQLRIE